MFSGRVNIFLALIIIHNVLCLKSKYGGLNNIANKFTTRLLAMNGSRGNCERLSQPFAYKQVIFLLTSQIQDRARFL